MAITGSKVSLPLEALDHAASFLGGMDPEEFKRTSAALADPTAIMDAPNVGMSSLRPYQPMPSGPAPVSSVAPVAPVSELRPRMLGPLPPPQDITASLTKPSVGSRAKGILGTIGQIAGSALIPGVMPWIPGTEQHSMLEQKRGEEKAISEADVEEKKAMTKEHGETAEARKREYMAPKMGTQGYMTLNPQSNEYEYHEYPEGQQRPKSLDQAEADLFHSRVKERDDPYTVLGDIYAQRAKGLKPDKESDFEKALGEARKANPTLDAVDFRKQWESAAGGKGFEEAAYQDALKANPGLTRDKFIQDRENRAANRQAENQNRAFANQEKLTAAREQADNQKQIRKPYREYEDSDENYRFMQTLADEMKKKGKIDGPESVALLARHMGINFPPGTGMRQSIQMIQAHAETRSYPQAFQAWLQKFDPDAGGIITPEQAQAFVEMANLQRHEKYEKLQRESSVFGANIDKIPGPDSKKPTAAAGPAGPTVIARPDHVPANYTFKHDGPKGPGWYKP